MSSSYFEPGQVVRWRGARWRTLGERAGGCHRHVRLDPGLRDVEITPLLESERDVVEPDKLPLPSSSLRRAIGRVGEPSSAIVRSRRRATSMGEVPCYDHR